MKKMIIILLVSFSLMWVLHTFSKNFIVDPSLNSFLSRKDQLLTNEALWLLMVQLHIALAIISLITGPLGVIKALRRKSLSFHRWNGRIYVLSILLNFIPGVYVSFFATGGWISTVGFLVLNTLWLVTTFLGYFYARKRQIGLHSRWITRSFLLSFANMTIYIIVAISHHAVGFSYGASYTIAVWLCWIINLLLAEWIIRAKMLTA
ncbi:DUF2306 domain-containing protein [Alkalihalobacillus oceani]|uniref:DUF2306 domain-containing protein n=1 Tax=Halalkalibacter oceani TaxID=1653776 RepID=UPI00203E0F57|nr:DUF2306 domain-containing protein [Halalkalibacter oceani]MCM3762483.1 DUF2306 domain-containing protein [Halalkalibacter oceani]